ncbi:MAG: Gfo/Idh/MocA family oxidoreductase [Planctomycetes bacterium]|nr:Gfo/Idh/MocA family oxidoreductase [Planctomycetota bacterium]
MACAGSAVVGTGFIGPVHIEALRRLGRSIIGVLGSTAEKSRRAAQSLGIERGYATFEELLADPDVRVVHLASPNRLHYDQCKQALTAGKHVICEKPLAMNVKESAELVALARQRGLVAAVCYNVRFYPLCLEAREWIASGRLGEIHHVTGSYVQDWLLHDTDFNWRVLPEEGGELRAIADIGTHWLDLIQSITGLHVTAVCADLKTVWPTRRRPKGSVETFQSKATAPADLVDVAIATEDYGSVLLHFDREARGCFSVSQVCAGRKNCLRFEIAGSTASLAWNSERPDELWIGERDRPNELLIRDPALLHPAARAHANYPGGHNEGFPDTFKQLFRSIYDYIDRGDFQADTPFPTFADGHREIVLCDAILQSQRTRGWVNVPL